MEKTGNVRGPHKAGVYDSVVVARTTNTFDGVYIGVQQVSPHGIIGPRTEFFTISNVHFINFDFNEAAALGDCSHCFHPAATDSGARTYFTEKLTFSNTKIRIRH
jgi:hypothetical protein